MNLGNVESVIFVCGMQVVCKGNEATGTVVFDLDGQDIEMPCCKDCGDYVQHLVDRQQD